ncbi:MAG: hypothetical protein WD844_03950 [Thermoleophilaceae bacterium]
MIGALVGALALAVAGIATAGTKNGVTFVTKYSTTTPGAPTGFTTSIEGAARDAQGRLDPANRVIVNFQRGTKFDTAVPARCDEDTLREEGVAGCPRRSIVGSGSAEAISGLAAIDPIQEEITAVNTRGGIIFYLTGLQTLILEGKLRGSRLTVDVPPLPIPGNPKGAVLTKFELKIKRIRRGRRAYVTTPRTCSRRWTVRATFQYPNVDDIRSIPSNTRCKKPRRSRR